MSTYILVDEVYSNRRILRMGEFVDSQAALQSYGPCTAGTLFTEVSDTEERVFLCKKNSPTPVVTDVPDDAKYRYCALPKGHAGPHASPVWEHTRTITWSD